MNIKIDVSTFVARPSSNGEVEIYGTSETSETVRIGLCIDQSMAERFLEASQGWPTLEIPEEKFRSLKRVNGPQ